jgi:hypothetical protein
MMGEVGKDQKPGGGQINFAQTPGIRNKQRTDRASVYEPRCQAFGLVVV